MSQSQEAASASHSSGNSTCASSSMSCARRMSISAAWSLMSCSPTQAPSSLHGRAQRRAQSIHDKDARSITHRELLSEGVQLAVQSLLLHVHECVDLSPEPLIVRGVTLGLLNPWDAREWQTTNEGVAWNATCRSCIELGERRCEAHLGLRRVASHPAAPPCAEDRSWPPISMPLALASQAEQAL